MANVTGPNQFSLAVGHRTTAKVDDCTHGCFLDNLLLFYCTTGVDVTAGPWPVYLRSGQSNWTKIGPLGQLIFSGHLGQQLSFLPCHSISTDNRLMKFPDKTLNFNFNHSPKAINSLITQSSCVYLDLLPHVKRILTEIYAGNQYFIIQ